MENMTYKLSDFEGPLDLLIALIEKNKMNILDISISTICDQYLEFLNQAQAMDMEIATEFLNMASQLMVWKSAELIPHEEEAEKPPRFDLSDILIRHQHAKEAAPKMHPLYAYYSNRMVKDTDEIAPDKTYVADQQVTDLITAVRRINAYRDSMERAKTNFTPMVSKPIVPVEGKIVIILNTLATFGTATLRELLIDAPSLADMIASFMGVLELIKVRKILIEENAEAEEDSVHGEGTRFFINPDSSDVEESDLEADFSSAPEKTPEPTKTK
ncbi:MAG: segregation/condensation protein A [Clostridia bacterium]|nr:segregation/condensation protein A [Clostridia bacterium]